VTVLRFTVLGKPQPAGSKRAFAIKRGGVPTGKVAVSDDNPRAKSWQQEVRATAALAFITADPDWSLLDGPLELCAWFYVPRPRSHYRTGRNADLLRDNAPPYPIVRPDTTKLLRGLEDALTGVVWRDDAQVVVQTARKVFGEPARTMVEVWRLPDNGPTVLEQIP
jgi:Holliday junction resolvase RusA-like endonuclease